MEIDNYSLILILFFIQVLISITIVKLFIQKKQTTPIVEQQKPEYLNHAENQLFVSQVDEELEKILEARRNNQIH